MYAVRTSWLKFMKVRLTRCPRCICIIHGQLALPTDVPDVDVDLGGPDSDSGRNPMSVRTGCPPYTAHECLLPAFTDKQTFMIIL